MLASKLILEVQRITDNSDYSSDEILAILNRGLLEIAGGGDRQHGIATLAPLPDLFIKGTLTVTGGSNSKTMPSTYHRSLQRIVKSNGDKLRRFDNLNLFLDLYEGQVGPIEAYCLKGRTLWVAPVSATDTVLSPYYYRYPSDMTITAGLPLEVPPIPATDDEPDGIPSHLVYNLLVNFACREIYAEVESGVDMAHPDTDKHDFLYQKALTNLERFIGPEEGEAQNVNDDYLTEDNI